MPRRSKTVNIQFRAPRALAAELDALAQQIEDRPNRSEMIRRLLGHALGSDETRIAAVEGAFLLLENRQRLKYALGQELERAIPRIIESVVGVAPFEADDDDDGTLDT